jgi:hypothetical protein
MAWNVQRWAKRCSDEKRTGRSADLVQSVDQQNCERQHFTISELSCEVSQISRTPHYDVITVRLGYHKFCARLVPKMLTGAHITQGMASTFTFLKWYHKGGDDFLSYIIRVTCVTDLAFPTQRFSEYTALQMWTLLLNGQVRIWRLLRKDFSNARYKSNR